MDVHLQPLTWNRLFLGIAVVFAVMLLCVGGFVLTIDSQCVAELNERIPQYPNAVFISETHSFLRMYGMGSTVTIWQSADDPNTIDSWYGRKLGAAVKRANSGIARSAWDAMSLDGGGSQIILYGNCVN
jgi:hypothetical protein